jgi:hypothetical protein
LDCAPASVRSGGDIEVSLRDPWLGIDSHFHSNTGIIQQRVAFQHRRAARSKTLFA